MPTRMQRLRLSSTLETRLFPLYRNGVKLPKTSRQSETTATKTVQSTASILNLVVHSALTILACKTAAATSRYQKTTRLYSSPNKTCNKQQPNSRNSMATNGLISQPKLDLHGKTTNKLRPKCTETLWNSLRSMPSMIWDAILNAWRTAPTKITYLSGRCQLAWDGAHANKLSSVLKMEKKTCHNSCFTASTTSTVGPSSWESGDKPTNEKW